MATSKNTSTPTTDNDLALIAALTFIESARPAKAHMLRMAILEAAEDLGYHVPVCAETISRCGASMRPAHGNVIQFPSRANA